MTPFRCRLPGASASLFSLAHHRLATLLFELFTGWFACLPFLPSHFPSRDNECLLVSLNPEAWGRGVSSPPLRTCSNSNCESIGPLVHFARVCRIPCIRTRDLSSFGLTIFELKSVRSCVVRRRLFLVELADDHLGIGEFRDELELASHCT